MHKKETVAEFRLEA